MESKAYIITFDKGGLSDNFDYKKFHEQLTNLSWVITWWHYLESVYIIIVRDLNSDKINDKIMEIMPKKRVFVARIDWYDYNGWLPPDAWEWLKQRREERFMIK